MAAAAGQASPGRVVYTEGREVGGVGTHDVATEVVEDETISDRDVSTEDEQLEDVETPEEAEALVNNEAEASDEEGTEAAAKDAA